MSIITSSKRPSNHSGLSPLHYLAGTVLLATICHPAIASASCVNPSGRAGCYSTIVAAVAAASPGTTIHVAPGTYKEDVVIGKELSLIGADPASTIIDAAGLSNGIFIDGIDNPGLSNVLISGFTVEDANFEGILVANASSVTIRGNHVLNNDTSLDVTTDACNGPAAFETGETFDCGEGIHLLGAEYSTVADNVVENNSGGILLSDDTAENHDNLITGNFVKNNAYACGIVLASHAPAVGSTAAHNGIVHNTISHNTSTQNGFQLPGAGAGVGIFTDGSGVGTNTGNIIVDNDLTDNGLPGIAFHSHVGPNFHLPPDNLNDNIIIGNRISGNGADTGDTATPGPTGINLNSGAGGSPITGTVISGNVIDHETDDVAINTPAEVNLHFNNLLGGQTGVANLGSGTINATNNYWGCFNGPGSRSCSGVSGTGIVFIPFLRIPIP